MLRNTNQSKLYQPSWNQYFNRENSQGRESSRSGNWVTYAAPTKTPVKYTSGKKQSGKSRNKVTTARVKNTQVNNNTASTNYESSGRKRDEYQEQPKRSMNMTPNAASSKNFSKSPHAMINPFDDLNDHAFLNPKDDSRIKNINEPQKELGLRKNSSRNMVSPMAAKQGQRKQAFLNDDIAHVSSERNGEGVRESKQNVASSQILENESLQTKLMVAQQKLNMMTDTQETVKMLKAKNKSMEEELHQIRQENINLKSELDQTQAMNVDLNERIQNLEKQNGTLQQGLNETKSSENTLKKDKRQLQSKVNSLETQVSSLKEKNKNVDSENEQWVVKFEKLQKDNQDLVKKIIEISSQVQRQGQMERKIQQLIQQNAQLEKGHLIYIPHKYDKIDLALAQFINEYPEREKMKILFLRESEGVYTFGRKKVNVKVEKGNQIYIRVGGGFLHIMEFLNQYTPLEVKEIRRKMDPSSRFQQKLQTQRTSLNRSNSSMERQPIGQSSPPFKRVNTMNSQSSKSSSKKLPSAIYDSEMNVDLKSLKVQLVRSSSKSPVIMQLARKGSKTPRDMQPVRSMSKSPSNMQIVRKNSKSPQDMKIVRQKSKSPQNMDVVRNSSKSPRIPSSQGTSTKRFRRQKTSMY